MHYFRNLTTIVNHEEIISSYTGKFSILQFQKRELEMWALTNKCTKIADFLSEPVNAVFARDSYPVKASYRKTYSLFGIGI